MKQTSARRKLNIATKRNVKTAEKDFLAKPSAEALSKAHGAIDTAVKKNVLNKATASRKKSALSKIAKDSGVKLAKKAPAKKNVTKKTTTKSSTSAKAKTQKTTTKKTTTKKKSDK